MHSHGEASGITEGFVHQALIYDSDQEFMEVVLPFVGEGLSSGEPTLVAVQGRHVQNLRAALGGTPEGLTRPRRARGIRLRAGLWSGQPVPAGSA